MKTLDDKTLTRLKTGGVWIPSPLALDRNKRPSEKWQRLLTLYYIRAGARTIVPGAHTGEFSGGNLEIYRYWLGLIKEMVAQYGGGEMFLMAAVSGKGYMRQAELAAREGYDIVMLAPTAFTKKSDREVVRIFRDVARVIPVFGFELQKLVPGSRDFTYALWEKIFAVSYGAKSAPFNTYRAQTMLEAAANSARREELVLITGLPIHRRRRHGQDGLRRRVARALRDGYARGGAMGGGRPGREGGKAVAASGAGERACTYREHVQRRPL
jgi:hypothetical protein